MSTSDQDQPRGGEGGAGTAAAPQPQAEASAAEQRGAPRHGRGRRGRTGGRHEPPRPQQQQSHAPRRADSTLNMDELRELTELFTEHGLTDFEFENADIRIRLSRNAAPQPPAAAPPAAHVPQAAPHAAASQGAPPPSAAAPAAAPPAATPAAAEEAPEEELHVITSPIVGTFYRSPSPQAESFVKIGSQVEPDTVVCIIEAMKLMSEIPAETTGTIAKIYVENGQAVEFEQPLFGVKK